MSIGDFIKNILETDILAGDVLRVLTLFNGVLWESEVRWEIKAMDSTLGIDIELSDLSRKLSLLAEKNIIVIDKRIKGSLSDENMEDNLIKLMDPYMLFKILKEDSKLMEYVDIRKKVYEKKRR